MNKKEQRKFIYEMFNGKCAYCGCNLPDRWHIDHIEPVIRDFKYDKDKGWVQTGKFLKPENDNLENKFPSCPSCNIQKHAMSIEQFRNKISHFIYSLNNYHNQYKFAKKYGLVCETGEDVVFYYEKFLKEETRAEGNSS